MKAILCGLTVDVSSQVDKCRSTKSLWYRLKKLYGNKPTTAEPTCDDRIRNASHVFVDDERRSASSRSIDEEGTHLFMAQKSEDERHTSENDHTDHPYRQDVFGSDSEGEEEEEAEVDLEGELISRKIRPYRSLYIYYKIYMFLY